MTFALGKRSRENLKNVRPDLIKCVEKALSYGVIDFGVPARSSRTKAEQAELYAQGRTKPGKIVTWTLKSNHIIDPKIGFASAVDLVPWINGKFVWDEDSCRVIAEQMFRAAEELGIKNLEWGQEIWGKDMPHFQILGKVQNV